jgi:SAM-dependent methyltransferase
MMLVTMPAIKVLTVVEDNFIDMHASNEFIATSLLPPPYKDIQPVLPFDDHGWYKNARWIQKIFFFNDTKIKTVVEVGSWLGKSTRHIGQLLPKNGKLYSIDTWKGSIEDANDKVAQDKLPTLYEQFLSNTIRAKLTDKIIPIKSDSLLAAETLAAINPDLIYLDAAYDTDSVLKNLSAWYPFVKGKRGILCGDNWYWDSVKIALRRFCQEHNLALYVGENFWFIKETGVFEENSFINQQDEVWFF